MRIRTVWNWRLKLYPIVVIPLMVYFVAAQGNNASRPRAQELDEAPAAEVAVVPSSGLVPPFAAPLSAFTQGRAVTCERRAEITFCYMLKQPNTVIDR